MGPYELAKKNSPSQDFTRHFAFRNSLLKRTCQGNISSALTHCILHFFQRNKIIYPQVNEFLLLQKQEKLNHANSNALFQSSYLIFTKPKVKYQKNCDVTALNKSKEPNSEYYTLTQNWYDISLGQFATQKCMRLYDESNIIFVFTTSNA